MIQPRVLLLNPPAPDVVIRDYYCSKTTRSDYVYAPIDLVMQSGHLAAAGFDVRLLDAVPHRTPVPEVYGEIARIQPDAVLSLVGAVTWESDLAFLRGLKDRHPALKIALSGDVPQEDPAAWLARLPFADFVLGDFTAPDLAAWLAGDTSTIRRSAWREADRIESRSDPRVRKGSGSVPLPRHDLFLDRGYRFSFVRRPRFATTLTDFGCPYPCTFCIMGTLGHAMRPLDEVMAELRHLRSLGVHEIFFLDQTWGADRERTLALCDRMARETPGFGWVTFTRCDVVTPAILAAWAKAGCHTLIFGVEFADPEMHRRYRKGYRPTQVASALAAARAAGIRTVGTFLLGLPEDTRESIAATARLARELPLDFASFSVAVPRHGTKLRGEAVQSGLAPPGEEMDQSGATVAMPTRSMSRDEVLRAKNRAILQFYLRPSWIARRVRGASSWYELRAHAREGAALLRRTVS